ncbi:MAG: hypothetical protein ISS36_04770 [Candidatus Aenigmarchaeota archaeon]|nr:hypothetical protein [Candidatus Aenigmarchaeota archaeon]
MHHKFASKDEGIEKLSELGFAVNISWVEPYPVPRDYPTNCYGNRPVANLFYDGSFRLANVGELGLKEYHDRLKEGLGLTVTCDSAQPAAACSE